MHAKSTRRPTRAGTAGRTGAATPGALHQRRQPGRTGDGQGRHPGGSRRRRRTALATIVALASVAAACGTAPPGDGEAAPPTFSRASGASLAFEHAVSNVADLVAPVPDAEEPEWLIVGSTFEPDAARSVATVWTSADGTGWEAATPASSGEDEGIAAATRTDDGVVAVGRVGAVAEADAAVWTRADGEWTVATPGPMGGDHEQRASDVAAGPSGIVVAGSENAWGDVRPRLWFSADGVEWETVDGGPGGTFDATGEESVRAVSAFGDGFVAVGLRTVDNEQDGMAWYSPDGRSWEEIDAPMVRGPGRQQLLSVTQHDGVLIAGGMSDLDGNGQGDPVVWRSADGRTWDPPSGLAIADNRTAARDLAVRSVTSSPTAGLVAAGGNDWRPQAWHSTDGGAVWNPLPDVVHGDLFLDGVDLRAIASLGTVTVAIAAEPTVLRLEGPRWEDATGDAFPKQTEQPFATSVATDAEGTAIAAGGRITAAAGETRERFVGQLWRRDGDGWEAIDSATLAAGQVLDVSPFEGGYVAVGHEDFGVAAGRNILTDDPEPDGTVWMSPNGRDWARIGLQDVRTADEFLQFLDDPSIPGLAGTIAEMEAQAPAMSSDPAGGDGTRSLNAVVPFQSGFIAVGSRYDADDGEPIILISSDGTTFVAEAPPHGGAGTQLYTDVCIDPDGVPVAVGYTGSPGAYDAIATARIEGSGWVPAEGANLAVGGDQQVTACAASDDGYIMVGYDDSTGNRDARVWTSDDGLSWSEVESSILGGTGEQWASAVAPVPGGGWLIAGTDTASGDGDIALWRLDEDGELTRRDRGERALRGPGEQTITSIDIDEDGHVTLAGNDYGRVGLWESDSVDR